MLLRSKIFLHRLLHFSLQVAQTLGIKTTFVDAYKAGEIERSDPSETVLIYIETPSNPALEIVDIRKIAKIAEKCKTPFIRR